MRFDKLARRRRGLSRPWVRTCVALPLRGRQGGSSRLPTSVEFQPARLRGDSTRKPLCLRHLCAKPDSLSHGELCLSVLSRPPPKHLKRASFVSQAETDSRFAGL